jgi:NAD(P)-dependent dehydrogenase (short-subunit alcohol dehydrogenase family)
MAIENFKGRNALITGGASGIGLALAHALASEGARVGIADIDGTGAHAAADAINAGGGTARAYRCDVTRMADITKLADAAWADFGQVDLLFNNAGVMPKLASLIDVEENDLRWVYEVNVFGAWNVCKVFAARLIAQPSPSHIVNTGSENSLCSLAPMLSAYNSAKHAVLGFTGILRMELPEHVGISLFCPGIVKTNLSASVERKPPEFGGPEANLLGGMSIGMEPAEAAARCLAGVKRGDYFIVTHYATRYAAGEMCKGIMDAFDEQTAEYEGWEAWDSRRLIMSTLGNQFDKN